MRSWLLELILAAGALLLGFFLISEPVGDGDGHPPVLEAVTGAVAAIGMIMFRRSRPVALALALIPLGIVFGVPMGAVPFVLFAVAAHRPARVVLALAGLQTAAVTVIYLLVLGATQEYYEAVVFVLLLYLGPVAAGMVLRANRLRAESWALRVRDAEDGQRLRVEQARLGERTRIAREMHDALGHRLSLLAVHSGALAVRRDATPEERAAAEVVRRGAFDAMEDLRQVIGMLREPGAADDRPQPTLADVPALAEQSRQAGSPVELELAIATGGDDAASGDAVNADAAGGGAPAAIERHAYRIVQEALTNARKHAPGRPVTVSVRGGPAEGLVVRVSNPLGRGDRDGGGSGDGRDGCADGGGGRERDGWADGGGGRERDGWADGGGLGLPAGGAGLAGLRERVVLAGGRLEHGPAPGGTFELRAWLPW